MLWDCLWFTVLCTLTIVHIWKGSHVSFENFKSKLFWISCFKRCRFHTQKNPFGKLALDTYCAFTLSHFFWPNLGFHLHHKYKQTCLLQNILELQHNCSWKPNQTIEELCALHKMTSEESQGQELQEQEGGWRLLEKALGLC